MQRFEKMVHELYCKRKFETIMRSFKENINVKNLKSKRKKRTKKKKKNNTGKTVQKDSINNIYIYIYIYIYHIYIYIYISVFIAI